MASRRIIASQPHRNFLNLPPAKVKEEPQWPLYVWVTYHNSCSRTGAYKIPSEWAQVAEYAQKMANPRVVQPAALCVTLSLVVPRGMPRNNINLMRVGVMNTLLNGFWDSSPNDWF